MNCPAHYAAKMASVDVLWRLRNSRDVTIDSKPRLVLAFKAARDVEMTSLLVQYPGLRVQKGRAEALLVAVPHIVGLRRLKPEGEPWVYGQEDQDAAPMFGGKPEDQAGPLAQVRWHGDTVQVIEHNSNPHPYDFWSWRGRVSVPKGFCLGVVIQCDIPTFCRVKLSGE